MALTSSSTHIASSSSATSTQTLTSGSISPASRSSSFAGTHSTPIASPLNVSDPDAHVFYRGISPVLVGDTLAFLRGVHNLSISELALNLGTTKLTLSQLESGKRFPSFDLLLNIAQAYSISFFSLIYLLELRAKQHQIEQLEQRKPKVKGAPVKYAPGKAPQYLSVQSKGSNFADNSSVKLEMCKKAKALASLLRHM